MREFNENFESRIPLNDLSVILELSPEFDFDPTSSVEMEDYWVKLLGEYHGEKDALQGWLRQRIVESFRCISSRPEWIQNPNWQVSENGPMTFIGQVDAPRTAGIFHDDAVFYVFFDAKSGEIRTVLQVA